MARAEGGKRLFLGEQFGSGPLLSDLSPPDEIQKGKGKTTNDKTEKAWIGRDRGYSGYSAAE
jgi:hypothetical protein